MSTAQQGERKDKMKELELDKILVADRYREELGDLEELVASIKEKGLIQPVTVDDRLNLLAGGRRIAAAKIAGLKHVPVIIRPFVDKLDSLEIELFENVHRKDFTWAERAKITKQINDLYTERNAKGEWSGRKTAALLDRSVGSVAADIKMAEYLEHLPELAKFSTSDEAQKFIKKAEEEIVTNELAKRQKTMLTNSNDGTSKGVKDTIRVASENYRLGDCFVGMKDLRTNGNITFIECDPPYGIDLNEQKASRDSVGSTVDGYNEVDRAAYPEFLNRLANELFRVASKDCWMVFWFGPTWQREVLDALRDAKWLVDEIPALWVKSSGQTQAPEVNLARGYEPFFICRKGKPVLNKRGRLNTFQFPGCATLGPFAKYHPTQRPVELIEEIFETFMMGQEVVLIPFLGSGATLRACYNRGVLGYGWDLDGKYKDKFLLAVEADARKNLSS